MDITNLAQLTKAVRDLSYDRFPVPVIALKSTAPTTKTYQLTSAYQNRAQVLRLGTGAIYSNITLFSGSGGTSSLLDDVYNNIVGAGYTAAKLPYLITDEVATNFYIKDETNIDTDQYLVMASFYSDTVIQQTIINYLNVVLNSVVTTSTLAQAILDIYNAPTPADGQKVFLHLTHYCALSLISYRRLVEYTIKRTPIIFSDGTTTTDGSLPPLYAFSDSASGMSGDNISVNIGGVFQLTDEENDNGPNNQSAGNEFFGASGMPGTELFFNDENTFWYRYFCYIRSRIEDMYGDYSFRHDSGIWGTSVLSRDLNYRTYFDSYPFTLSTMTRGL